MVAAANDRLFATLVEAVALPDLASESALTTDSDRVSEPRRADAVARGAVLDGGPGDLDRAAGSRATPAAPVAEVAAEQTEALGILQELPHPTVQGLRIPAFPSRSTAKRLVHHSAPPKLGAHTREVLAEAGYSEQEIDEAVADGAVG